MRVIIDRFEGRYAVVQTEDEKTYNIDKALLPNSKEGDSIIITRETSENDETKTRKLFKKLLID